MNDFGFVIGRDVSGSMQVFIGSWQTIALRAAQDLRLGNFRERMRLIVGLQQDEYSRLAGERRRLSIGPHR